MIQNRLYFSLGMLLTVAVTALGDEATPTGHPYGEIHSRNGFDLHKVEPAPVATTPVEAKATADFYLTGIVTLDETRYAMVIHRVSGQRTEHLTLKAGDRCGDFEVLEIDEHGGAVKVKANGGIELLKFDKHYPPPTDKDSPVPPLPK